MVYCKGMLTITGVLENSVGQELGLTEGDKIIAFGRRECNDLIDYIYWDTQEAFVLVAETGGEVVEFDVEKTSDETLGLTFFEDMPIARCKNNCIFCFVNQLPKGMRKSLYVKDDDWRQSVINGNFVTLTNIKAKDFERILEYGISPLYVSVHATDNEIRKKILQTKHDTDIMPKLKRLYERGIILHTQAVIAPGINDGEVLRKTIRDLKAVARSLAVVPVGLTKYSDKALNPLSQDAAANIIRLVDSEAADLKKEGVRDFVFCSDEMYLRAGIKPPKNTVDWQLGNGVGVVDKFETEFIEALNALGAGSDAGYTSVDVATGEDGYEILKGLLERFCVKHPGIQIKLHKIDNNFFGTSVTVSGLLTGGDIISQIRGKLSSKTLLLPENLLRAGTDILLDGLTLCDIETALEVRAVAVKIDGAEFCNALCMRGGQNK